MKRYPRWYKIITKSASKYDDIIYRVSAISYSAKSLVTFHTIMVCIQINRFMHLLQSARFTDSLFYVRELVGSDSNLVFRHALNVFFNLHGSSQHPNQDVFFCFII